MGAMVRFKNETGRDVSALKEGDIADLIVLLWCCIKSACNADGVAFEEPIDLFADTLDSDVLQEFVKGLADQSASDGQKKRPERRK